MIELKCPKSFSALGTFKLRMKDIKIRRILVGIYLQSQSIYVTLHLGYDIIKKITFIKKIKYVYKK